MNAAAACVGVLLLLLVVLTYRRLGALERDWARMGAAIRKDIDDLHAAHEYARVEHLRILTDVESATVMASNEVRMAAGTVRAITDALARQGNGAGRVVRR